MFFLIVTLSLSTYLYSLACNSDLANSIICVTFASEILNIKRL